MLHVNVVGLNLKLIENIKTSSWLPQLTSLDVMFHNDHDKVTTTRENKTLSTFVPLLQIMTSLVTLSINANVFCHDDDFNTTFKLPKLTILYLGMRTIPNLSSLRALSKVIIEFMYVKDLLRVLTETSHVEKITIRKIHNGIRNDDPHEYNDRVLRKTMNCKLLKFTRTDETILGLLMISDFTK